MDVAKLFFGADTSLGEAPFSEKELDAGSNIMNLLVLARLSSLLHRMHRYEEIEPYMVEFYFLYVKFAPTETRLSPTPPSPPNICFLEILTSGL